MRCNDYNEVIDLHSSSFSCAAWSGLAEAVLLLLLFVLVAMSFV